MQNSTKDKRPRKRINEVRKGDVYRAKRDRDSLEHVWVMMHDCKDATAQCVRAFNFTSSSVPDGEYIINVTGYNLPGNWFASFTKEKMSYIRINDKDCLKKSDIIRPLGNIEEVCPGLIEKICKETYACKVAADLKEICDCDYRIMDKRIELEQMKFPECDCNNVVYFS